MELDTFLLSCRALGRGIEQAFLNAIMSSAVTANISKLVAAYVEGPRNQPIANFLRNSGFEETKKGVFSMQTCEAKPPPSHIEITFSKG
jgi:predicted enzyme involved in methoxymalonyl-ACP biosynthesis